MHQAGADQPSANRITLLRDADGDGVAEIKEVFLENLNSPFGMALVGDQLYVANADSLVRFRYKEGDTRIEAPPEKVVDLPSGRNHHWTKSLVADPVGSRLYVGVGSNSNVAENGMDEEHNRADILEINPVTADMRVFASGLRNPVGMDWNPATGDLWVAVNERDETRRQSGSRLHDEACARAAFMAGHTATMASTLTCACSRKIRNSSNRPSSPIMRSALIRPRSDWRSSATQTSGRSGTARSSASTARGTAIRAPDIASFS